ncbi:MAG TPA: hypothetical protein VKB93_06640 [Thermoanaerobaculia bacterium]|nr:hypothetical protein [Thermoanaerobaculia bacterium]
MTIRALRILPPLAIARLGSSPDPLENYDVRVSEVDPLGFRELHGAPTFDVDRKRGVITRVYTPPDPVRFQDKRKRVKPVAPFLEVWADVDGTLVPLTMAHVSAGDVEWRVQVGNQKAFRRTRDPLDRIDADTGWFTGHAPHKLLGRCEHFLPKKTLPFGDVQFLQPTGEFPEIRARFTPGKGVVYGATGRLTRDKDVADVIYDSRRGAWDGWSDDNMNPTETITNPGYIYARLDDERSTSRGYLDDECDGLVEVRIAKLNLSAFARIGAGPPDYAPDSFPVRTVADELEQVLLGPHVADEDVSPEWTEEILRRAFETVRLQNTVVLNGNPVTADDPPQPSNCMVLHDSYLGRAIEPIMARALVDTIALRALHQSVFAALQSGSAPWFSEVLREWDEVGDLSDKGRRKMPAMMRGSDGLHLALTRRQYNAIRGSGNRQASEQVVFSTPAPPEEEKE